MSEWISVKDQMPPKDKPFLVYTTGLIEMMDWKEKIVDGISTGWYAFYTPCSCCAGYCSGEFELWMPLPSPPEKQDN